MSTIKQIQLGEDTYDIAVKAENVEGLTIPSYLSLERIKDYLYKITFDNLPELTDELETNLGACSSYIKDGKLYRNLDWTYAETAEFIVKTKRFEGMAYINGMNDGELDENKLKKLPYQVCDGVNEDGIMVATHVLYNDWDYDGAGDKDINILNIPFLILNNIKTLTNFSTQMSDYLSNIQIPEGLADMEYLLQFIVSDGTTTYVIAPPESATGSYTVIDATANPKLTNFRWVSRTTVARSDNDLQTRPTGIERYNAMPCAMKDLRFTKAYETDDYLSEFIGEAGTTKASTDAELFEIYEEARDIYLERERDGQTWQTMHSVVYSSAGMEELYIQEDFDNNVSGKASSSLPAGGTTGQVLKKSSNTDYAVEWGDAGSSNIPIIEFSAAVHPGIYAPTNNPSIYTFNSSDKTYFSNKISELYVSGKDKFIVHFTNTGYTYHEDAWFTYTISNITEKPTSIYLFNGTVGGMDSNCNPQNITAATIELYGSWTDDVFTCNTGRIRYQKATMLSTTNTDSYTPTQNYHPATKKYVDDSIASAITSALGGNY